LHTVIDNSFHIDLAEGDGVRAIGIRAPGLKRGDIVASTRIGSRSID
jgi:hypothetical protein